MFNGSKESLGCVQWKWHLVKLLEKKRSARPHQGDISTWEEGKVKLWPFVSWSKSCSLNIHCRIELRPCCEFLDWTTASRDATFQEAVFIVIRRVDLPRFHSPFHPNDRLFNAFIPVCLSFRIFFPAYSNVTHVDFKLNDSVFMLAAIVEIRWMISVFFLLALFNYMKEAKSSERLWKCCSRSNKQQVYLRTWKMYYTFHVIGGGVAIGKFWKMAGPGHQLDLINEQMYQMLNELRCCQVWLAGRMSQTNAKIFHWSWLHGVGRYDRSQLNGHHITRTKLSGGRGGGWKYRRPARLLCC